jgi:NADH/NAD ratio-sensing transcriptional regulator Rex
LSVKNPNGGEEVKHRTPQEILDEIEKLDEEAAEVLAGIRGLLNFAPVSLTDPPDVALNAVDLAVQLEQLSFQVSIAYINKAS